MSRQEPVLTPSLAYVDPLSAIEWLARAFGFEIAMLLTDEKGAVAHAEMSFGGARIGVMGEWASEALLGPAKMKSPKTLGASSQFIWVNVDDVETHCSNARRAGATIVQAPERQPYGALTYRALDLEGHVWNFRQYVADVPSEDFERKTGLKYVRTTEELRRRRNATKAVP